MKCRHRLLPFLLLLLSLSLPLATAVETSTDASLVGAINNSYTSMVFHQFYEDPSRRPQTPVLPWDECICCKGAASESLGAFRLEKPSVAYKTLKTGIPLKNGLHEFLHVEKSPRGNHSTVTGFSVIVFDDVMKMLPYHVPERFFLCDGDTHEPSISLTSQVYSKMDCESESSIIYKLLKDGFAATLPHPNCSGTSNLEGFKDFTNVSLQHGRSKALVENDMTGVKLRILVPSKNTFHEFVKVDYEPNENEMIATGYSVDVFKEVMDSLPYRVSYEFFPYENGPSSYMEYYDEVIQQLQLNKFDGIVGDITITSNRSKYGDFTQPYMMSGVSMIVPAGILVWIFEHEINPEFKGTFSEQVGKVLSFSFSISVFAQKEKLKSNYSRLVVNLWMFAVFVMVTTYASILQSMLTSDNDQPVFTRMEELIMNGDYVGYQKGSFVFDLLKHMGFQEQQLKAYSSVEEYAIALSRGSVNNGVSAIIDEIPYIKVFLAKYADRYMMAGPTFGPGGFGFLFKRDCAIVPNVSRAILEFIEGEKMPELEKKWFCFVSFGVIILSVEYHEEISSYWSLLRIWTEEDIVYTSNWKLSYHVEAYVQ
ncbi:hypothetical protein AAC387_Pa04g0655 [Persea americana]